MTETADFWEEPQAEPPAAGQHPRDQTQHQEAQPGWAVSRRTGHPAVSSAHPGGRGPGSPRGLSSPQPSCGPFPAAAGWGPGQLDGKKGERQRRKEELPGSGEGYESAGFQAKE